MAMAALAATAKSKSADTVRRPTTTAKKKATARPGGNAPNAAPRVTIAALEDKDVICAKYKHSSSHPGNVDLNDFILYKDRAVQRGYQDISRYSKKEKAAYFRAIIAHFECDGSRFVELDEATGEYYPASCKVKEESVKRRFRRKKSRKRKGEADGEGTAIVQSLDGGARQQPEARQRIDPATKQRSGGCGRCGNVEGGEGGTVVVEGGVAADIQGVRRGTSEGEGGEVDSDGGRRSKGDGEGKEGQKEGPEGGHASIGDGRCGECKEEGEAVGRGGKSVAQIHPDPE